MGGAFAGGTDVTSLLCRWGSVSSGTSSSTGLEGKWETHPSSLDKFLADYESFGITIRFST
jgi:hypothetical protein